jgi:hypothetical protein
MNETGTSDDRLDSRPTIPFVTPNNDERNAWDTGDHRMATFQ